MSERAQAPPRTEVGDTPEVAGEVRWRSAMETAVNENSRCNLLPASGRVHNIGR